MRRSSKPLPKDSNKRAYEIFRLSTEESEEKPLTLKKGRRAVTKIIVEDDFEESETEEKEVKEVILDEKITDLLIDEGLIDEDIIDLK